MSRICRCAVCPSTMFGPNRTSRIVGGQSIEHGSAKADSDVSSTDQRNTEAFEGGLERENVVHASCIFLQPLYSNHGCEDRAGAKDRAR